MRECEVEGSHREKGTGSVFKSGTVASPLVSVASSSTFSTGGVRADMVRLSK